MSFLNSHKFQDRQEAAAKARKLARAKNKTSPVFKRIGGMR